MRFIKVLKQNYVLSVKEFRDYCMLPVIGALLGILVSIFVAAMADGYIPVCTISSIGFCIFLNFFYGIYSVPAHFNMAVSMGIVRKYYIPARLFLMMNFIVCELLIINLIYLIENGIYSLILPGAAVYVSISDYLTHPLIVTAAIIGFPVISLFFGVLIMKFSNKVFWIIWGIWMFSTIGIPNIISRIKEATLINPDSAMGKIGLVLADILEGITFNGIMASLLLFFAALLAAAVIMLRKQRVTI